jgi:uncharacterized membrane protein
MRYETLHWRAFNIMARLFGLMALLAALGFLYSAFIQATDAAVSVSNMDATGYLLVAIFMLIVGIAFVKVAPYRPDLRVEKVDSTNATKSKVGWWTGIQKKD